MFSCLYGLELASCLDFSSEWILIREQLSDITLHDTTQPETLYWEDDALSTKPVMHYQGTAYLSY